MNCFVYDSVLPGLLLQSFGLVLPAEGMIVIYRFSAGFPGLFAARCVDFACLASATDAPASCLRKSHKSQSSFGTNFFAARSHFRGSSRLSFSRKGRSGFCGG